MSAEYKTIGTVVQLGDGFEAVRRQVDRSVCQRLHIKKSLREGYIENGMHPSRVDEYFEALANGKNPSFDDYKEPVQVADILAISYTGSYIRR